MIIELITTNSTKNLLELNQINISVIKDILWIIFSLCGSVIAILTYRRARYTLLQPIRTEVIKKQTEIMVEILETFNNELELKLDVLNITEINIIMLLKEYNLSDGINNFDEIYEELKKKESGALIVVEKNEEIHSFGLVKGFEKMGFRLSDDELNQKRFDDLEHGIVKMELLYITQKYQMTWNRLNKIANNEFLPLNIKNELNNVLDIVSKNFCLILKSDIENYILEFYDQRKTADSIKLDYVGTYNLFVDHKNNYSESIGKVKKIIRKYLLIDKKW